MIEDVERYKRICDQMTFLAGRMHDTFKQFIQLSIAITGGFFWLKNSTLKDPNLLLIARYFIPILALLSAFHIWNDFRIWRGYRDKEADFFPEIGKTTFWKQGWPERAFIASMIVIAAFAYRYLR